MALQIQYGNYVYAANNAYVEPDGWEESIVTESGPIQTLHPETAYPTTARMQGRDITVRGTITSPTWTSRSQLRSAVDAFLWAHRPGRVDKLYLYDDRYLLAQVIDSPTIVDSGLNYVKFSVRFRAADPYWYSVTPQSAYVSQFHFYSLGSINGEDFSTGWNFGNTQVASDTTTTPAGETISHNKLVEVSTQAPVSHYMYANVSVSDSVTYWWQVFAKPAERSWVYLYAYTKAGATRGAYFNLQNAVVGWKESGVIDARCCKIGDWVWCAIAVNSQSGTYIPAIGAVIALDDQNSNYVGENGKGIWLWGFSVGVYGIYSVSNNGIDALHDFSMWFDAINSVPAGKHVIALNMTNGSYIVLYYPPIGSSPSIAAGDKIEVLGSQELIKKNGVVDLTPWRAGDFIRLDNGYNVISWYVSNMRANDWSQNWVPRWL